MRDSMFTATFAQIAVVTSSTNGEMLVKHPGNRAVE
jgi:hypothetical protein